MAVKRFTATLFQLIVPSAHMAPLFLAAMKQLKK